MYRFRIVLIMLFATSTVIAQNVIIDSAQVKLLELDNTKDIQDLKSIIQELGNLKFKPAVSKISAYITNPYLKEVSLTSLANIESEDCEPILRSAMIDVGYKQDDNMALDSYIKYLNLMLYINPGLVLKASERMMKSIPGFTNDLLTAQIAALGLYVKSNIAKDLPKYPSKAGRDAIKYVIKALDNPFKEYRLAALDYAPLIKDDRIVTELQKKACESEMPVKAEIIEAFGKYNIAGCGVLESLNSNDPDLVIAAMKTAYKQFAEPLPEILKAMNHGDSRVIKAGAKILLDMDMNSEDFNKQIESFIPKAKTELKSVLINILEENFEN